ncbi:MAG: glycine zipper 2TM domain-containing protein [Candidatus Didemnitutus sp.]|nr:glycine zipper 2TM domain-containing protein [Candidatus Didemnitutus sp.]
MKNFLAIALLGATTLSVSAQTFRPNAVSGAVLGGIAGAVIGNNSGHGNGGKGALIGAAAGAVLGAAADDANSSRSAWRGESRTSVRVGVGYGYHDGWGRRDYRRHGGSYGYWNVGFRPFTPYYGYYSPRYTVWPSSYYGTYDYPSYAYSYPSYSYDTGYYGSGDSALGGALVGAGLGAIIGNNTGSGNGARGALWGALAGAVLGSTRDASVARPYRRIVPARAYETEVVAAQPAQQQAQPQQVTIVNNYYGNSSPMSSANSLFGR